MRNNYSIGVLNKTQKYWDNTLILVLFGGLIGAGPSALVRIELGTAGQLFGNNQIYNPMVTAPAFFIVIPILIGGVLVLILTSNNWSPGYVFPSNKQS